MKHETVTYQNSERERRRSYRLNDGIGLSYKIIAREELPQALAQFDAVHAQLELNDHFSQEKEVHLPLFKQIERTYPAVASYLRFLENKIDVLANHLSMSNHTLPNIPSHDVSLSAHGIRFFAERFIPSNCQMELRLLLFPSCVSLIIYATVVSCTKLDQSDTQQAYAITAEFSHIHESDKEVLVKHIHEKQMLALREKTGSQHT